MISVNWLTAGNYTLSITTGDSCGNSAIQSLSIIVKEIGGDDLFKIRVIPNPTPGQLYLFAKNVINKDINITITNMLGQIVYTKQTKSTTDDFIQVINFSNVANGIYNVKIAIGAKTFLQRLPR